ncbi:type I restriction endonuclease subunit R [Fructobacillus cardui]|uniref:Tetratricopeptide (TPR) repeat (TPR) n=1 Tax=Fructobacillus cardui TaxID=2893170 RepID=A0ABN9YN52_9LACO|nr:Tetratricopeptide (TPR) repeat (TPR) [Fructobacillus cardui]
MEKTLIEIKDQAEAEFNQEHYHQAADLFVTVYQEEQSLAVNRQLVLALKEDQQYQLAKDYATDFLSDYAQHENLFLLYFDLLLQIQNFVSAQQWTLQSPNQALIEDLLAQIRGIERKAEDQQGQTLKTIAQHFYHLSDESMVAQQERYQQAFHLPVATFVTGAKFLLVDPFASPLMRSTLLSDLQELGETGGVTYQWLDQQRYQIDLQAILPLFSNQSFQKLVAALDDQVGQEDPIAYQALFDQLRLEAMLLFPRLEESILDATAWVDADLSAFYQEQAPEEEAKQKQAHDLVLQALSELAG